MYMEDFFPLVERYSSVSEHLYTFDMKYEVSSLTSRVYSQVFARFCNGSFAASSPAPPRCESPCRSSRDRLPPAGERPAHGSGRSRPVQRGPWCSLQLPGPSAVPPTCVGLESLAVDGKRARSPPYARPPRHARTLHCEKPRLKTVATVVSEHRAT